MRRGLGYGLLGLTAYALFMLLLCPATVLTGWVVGRLPGSAIQQAQGSLLQGAAQGIHLPVAPLEAVSWRLRLLPLLLGRIQFYATLNGPQLQLSGNFGTDWSRQLQVADLKGQMPLPAAIALAGRPPPPLNGTLELAGLDLQLDQAGHPRRVQGLAQLRGVHTSFGKSLSLGDFSIEWQTREAAIVAVVKDQNGPLQLFGNLTLDPQGRYRFTGQAAVRDSGNRELVQALGLLGRPGENGVWTFDFSGNFQV